MKVRVALEPEAPSVTLGEEMESTGSTPAEKVSLALSPSASVAVQVWVLAAVTSVGVPLTRLVPALSATPAGRSGDSV